MSFWIRPRRDSAYQLLKGALVELPLGRPTLPQLLVVVLEALPVRPELFEARLVDVVQPARSQLAPGILGDPSIYSFLEVPSDPWSRCAWGGGVW